jgi:hypothetical protein
MRHARSVGGDIVSVNSDKVDFTQMSLLNLELLESRGPQRRIVFRENPQSSPIFRILLSNRCTS